MTIMLFWLPLAGMWLIMGIEAPAIAAVVSRLPGPTISLAAFEVALALALLIHSPVVQLLAAGTSFSRDRESFKRTFKMATTVIVSMTALHVFGAIPAVFRFLGERLLQVPPDVLDKAYVPYLAMAPISAAVGYRRLFQGALIRMGKTGAASMIIFSRLIATTVFLAGILLLASRGITLIPGELVAAMAFVIGVATGLIAALFSIHKHLYPAFDKLENENPRELESGKIDLTPGSSLSMNHIWKVYLPLALTTVILMASRPLLAFTIGRSQNPVDSLAAWSIIQSYMFVFNTIPYSFQEVVIARYDTHPDQRRILSLFALGIGISVTAVLALTAVTSFNSWWISTVISAPVQLMVFVTPGLLILLVQPLLTAGASLLSGTLVSRHQTRWIGIATILNIASQLILSFILPASGLPGASVASLIVLISLIVQTGILFIGRSRPA